LVVARLKFNLSLSLPGDDASIGLVIGAEAAGHFDSENVVRLYLNESDSGTVQAQYERVVSNVVEDQTVNESSGTIGQPLEYVVIHKIGTTYYGWVGTASGNWVYMGVQVHAGSLTRVGVEVRNARGDIPSAPITGVDFIRFYDTDNFLM
jgi:hypothetical protein